MFGLFALFEEAVYVVLRSFAEGTLEHTSELLCV